MITVFELSKKTRIPRIYSSRNFTTDFSRFCCCYP